MFNPFASASHAAPGRLVRVAPGVKGFVHKGRFVTPADPPFAVDDRKAADLLKQKLVVSCAAAEPEVLFAVAPGPKSAEKAVARHAR